MKPRDGWAHLADAAARAAGPLPRGLARAWRAELRAARQCVHEREGSVLGPDAGLAAGPFGAAAASSTEGLHALLVLAGARLGAAWDAAQLTAAAAAVELAHRATRHHDAVLDGACVRSHNTLEVLRGDWAITQAAGLVAEIGPAAYRVLVRGYGAAQLERLDAARPPVATALLPAAIELGALVAGVGEAGAAAASMDRLRQWARDVLIAGATSPVSLAAAR